ncbi:hypothetical protein [Scytonema hofmannii]|nr:hypothetical protein [Scytonema hofmannii]
MIPFHSGKVLHPKVVRQVMQAINIVEGDTTEEDEIDEEIL